MGKGREKGREGERGDGCSVGVCDAEMLLTIDIKFTFYGLLVLIFLWSYASHDSLNTHHPILLIVNFMEFCVSTVDRDTLAKLGGGRMAY